MFILITDYAPDLYAARAEVRATRDGPALFSSHADHPVTDCKRWLHAQDPNCRPTIIWT
jgi:hypothetical protein